MKERYFWLKKDGRIEELSVEKYRKIFNRISTTKEKTFVVVTPSEIGFITDGSIPKTVWLKIKQFKNLLGRLDGSHSKK